MTIQYHKIKFNKIDLNKGRKYQTKLNNVYILILDFKVISYLYKIFYIILIWKFNTKVF